MDGQFPPISFDDFHARPGTAPTPLPIDARRCQSFDQLSR
jgi:hypothetical protein